MPEPSDRLQTSRLASSFLLGFTPDRLGSESKAEPRISLLSSFLQALTIACADVSESIHPFGRLQSILNLERRTGDDPRRYTSAGVPKMKRGMDDLIVPPAMVV